MMHDANLHTNPLQGSSKSSSWRGLPGSCVNRAKPRVHLRGKIWRPDRTGDWRLAWLRRREKSTNFTVLCIRNRLCATSSRPPRCCLSRQPLRRRRNCKATGVGHERNLPRRADY